MSLLHLALQHAAASGMGSSAASGAAEKVRALAQDVRDYAESICADLRIQCLALHRAETSITHSTQPQWQSRTADLYLKAVQNHWAANAGFQRRLENTQAEVTATGAAVAQRLEELAAMIAAAGQTVDATIGAVASNNLIEEVADVFLDASVTAAQGALDDLMASPLILAAERMVR